MQYYPIISIDKKYLKYSEPQFLNVLKPCIVCNKIPLPSYKSVQNQKFTYCRDCYAEQNFDAKSSSNLPKNRCFFWELIHQTAN